jgi:hypothetical protein
MGDAAPRLVVDNGSIQWWYWYDYANDKGEWSKDGSTQRFTYDYANGAWWDDRRTVQPKDSPMITQTRCSGTIFPAFQVQLTN